MKNRPLRSVLYLPAGNERALAKAATLPVDALILDLEDATAVDKKLSSRDILKAKLATNPFGQRMIVIRINSIDTQWYEEDMAMAIGCKPDAILVPKISSVNDVSDILYDMERAGAAKDLALWVMIETPFALMNINEIAALAATTRLSGFVLGTNDLAKDMQIPLPTEDAPQRVGFLSYFSSVILAARAYGLVVLDGVFNNFDDVKGLEFEAKQAKQLGFDGKTLIHPKQIDVVNEVFAASDGELAFAQKIVEAFELDENANLGAIKIDGKMVERLHADMAKAALEKAKFYE